MSGCLFEISKEANITIFFRLVFEIFSAYINQLINVNLKSQKTKVSIPLLYIFLSAVSLYAPIMAKRKMSPKAKIFSIIYFK